MHLAVRTFAVTVVTGLLAVSSAAPAGVLFQEISSDVGLRFEHDPRADSVQGQNLYGPGVAIEDINGDGWLDVFLPNGPNMGNRMFLNDGNWSFTDVTSQMRVGISRGGNGVAFADIQNNGQLDLAVGNFHQSPYLFRRSVDRFQNVDEAYGLVPLIPGAIDFIDPSTGDRVIFPTPESMGVAFGDYDQDGYVDFYISNYRFQQDLLFRSILGQSLELTGAFPELDDAGDRAFYGFTGTFTDLDDDGDLDIYVANDFGINSYYQNQGPGGGYVMIEKARDLGIQGGNTDIHPKGLSMGLAIADYDNDLDLDIYITNFQLNILFENRGIDPVTGELDFVDVANSTGTEFPINCWGVDLADFDNDTDLDLIFAGGHIYSDNFDQPFDIADQFYYNEGPEAGYTFRSANEEVGFANTQFGRGLATGDLDRDGDLDVITTNNKYYDPTPDNPNQIFDGHTMVFRNDQDGSNHWVNLRLQGSFGSSEYEGVTNRAGIGAKVYLTTTDGLTMMREVQAGTSYLSHHSLEVEFGLGQADVQSVEVQWPGGAREAFTDIRSNRFYRLIEGSSRGTPVSLALSSFVARALDGGVMLEWTSAPGADVTGVVVDRADARRPDDFTRLDGALVTTTMQGGQVFDRTAVPGVTYRYRLGLRLGGGAVVESAVAEVTAGTTVPSRRAAVGQNYPNPFNPSTRIDFELPRTMHARLLIHDARGRVVRTLFDDTAAAGRVSVDWDGLDASGAPVASGVYHYVLITEDGTSARRMVLAR